MRLRTKIGAGLAAGTLVVGIPLATNAFASVPATLGYDVNTATESINFPSSPGTMSTESVECDAATDTLVGGGVTLDNASAGVPPRGFSWDVISSGPQVSGSASVKDYWTATVKGTNSAYDYDYTVYVICKKS